MLLGKVLGQPDVLPLESVNDAPRSGNPGGPIRRRVWQHILIQEHSLGVSQLHLVYISGWRYAAIDVIHARRP